MAWCLGRFVCVALWADSAAAVLAGSKCWRWWWLRMRCRACDRTIPEDALLCPYCGQSVFLTLPAPRSHVSPLPNQSKNPSQRQRLQVLLAYLFLICCAFCLLAAVALFAIYSPLMAGPWERLWDRIFNVSPLGGSELQPVLQIDSEGSPVIGAGLQGLRSVIKPAERIVWTVLFGVD